MATNPIAQAISPFIWGRGGAALTPEQVAREREVAEALMAQGIDTSPVGHWTQGAARMANVLAGKLKEGRASSAESAERAAFSDRLSSILGGGALAAPELGGAPATSTAMATAPAPDYASARVAQASNAGGHPVSADGWLNYANQGATRNLPLNDKLVQAMSFLPELGVTMKVVSGGQVGKGEKGGRVGSTRHDHGNAADVDFFIGDRKLTPKNEDDRAILSQIVQRGKAAGVTGWGEGDDYMGSGRVHLGFGNPGVWGAGGRGANAPEWLTAAYNAPFENPAVAANEAMAMGSVPSAQDPMAFQQPAMPMAEPRMVSDMPVADIAQSLTRATVNPDLPMAGNTSGFLPVAQSLAAQPQPQQQGGMPNMQQLIELASDPWATDAQRGVVQALLQQQMQAQDPMRQAQLEKLRLETEAMRNPAQKPIEVGGVLLDPGTMQPIFDSRDNTPSNVREYEYYANAETAAGRQPMPFGDWDQSRRRSGATNVTTNVGGENLTPGQKKIDEAFADTYLSWNSGGFADARKQMTQLDEALKILESGENVTGAIGALPDTLRPFINPNGTVARENVEEVVQRSLREILGAQFTEKEGERLISRAFNPLMSPAENAKRVRRLMQTIGSMADAKQDMVDYFDQNGTLRGYKGSRPTASQIERLADEFGKSPGERSGRTEIDGYVIEEVE